MPRSPRPGATNRRLRSRSADPAGVTDVGTVSGTKLIDRPQQQRERSMRSAGQRSGCASVPVLCRHKDATALGCQATATTRCRAPPVRSATGGSGCGRAVLARLDELQVRTRLGGKRAALSVARKATPCAPSATRRWRRSCSTPPPELAEHQARPGLHRSADVVRPAPGWSCRHALVVDGLHRTSGRTRHRRTPTIHHVAE